VAYNDGGWETLLFCETETLKIKSKTLRYVNEPFAWDFTPHDFAALAYYHLGVPQKSIPYYLETIRLAPDNERLKLNHRHYSEAVKNLNNKY